MNAILPVILVACALVGSVAWWLTLASRPDLRRELWPAFRFRRVPWGAADVLGAFVLVLLMAGLPWDQWLFQAVSNPYDHRSAAIDAPPLNLPGRGEDRRSVAPRSDNVANQDASQVPSEPHETPRKISESDQKRSHGLWILLQNRPTFAMFFLCFLVAVVAAPVMEETLFRLLLQGWLATREWQIRRWLNNSRRWSRRRGAESLSLAHSQQFGVVSVLVVAVCFSLIHFRSTSDVPSADSILAIMLRQLFGYGAAWPLLVLWLTLGRGVRLGTWGLARETFWPDVVLGLRWFATLAVPIYGLQVGLSAITPDSVVVDPLTLFPFGLVSGVLCLRTGRLLPAIVFHMALNGTSLALAAMLLLSGGFS
ncbi:CPBP family glutamic-type intramembrane protease [Thermopirellula anaerolimosa]